MRVSEFLKENVSESRLFRLVVEAGDNRLPIVNEGAQIVTIELSLSKDLRHYKVILLPHSF